MISLSRVALALVFLVGVWVDPTQPTRLAEAAYAVLGAYLLAAVVHAAITWDDWRLEARLAAPAHAGDLAIFGVMVFLTEGYTSPFFPLWIFILLSAAIKWGRRGTALTAAAITLVYVLAGLLALELGYGGFSLRQFLFRGGYLLVLSFVIIWFGIHQAGRRGAGELDLETAADGGSAARAMEAALDYAAAATGGRRGLFAWWEKEEPWIHLTRLDADGRATSERHPPGTFGEVAHARLAGRPFIFDSRGRRAMVRDGARAQMIGGVEPIAPALAEAAGFGPGLAIPVDSHGLSGLLMIGDVPGLCADDLALGAEVGGEVSAALRRRSLMRLSEEAAADRTRLALARDLHDGVAQLLAGTSMRLEGVRRAAGGGALAEEIAALQRELQAEQRGLRALIGRLRDEEGERPASLGDGLVELGERLSRQWGICCRVETGTPDPEVAAPLRHEIHHLVREAVANAVRHGNAAEVRVEVTLDQEGLKLTVIDNGCGFAAAGEGEGDVRPRSLSERAQHLGGRLRLSSGPGGSRLTVTIPAEAVR